MQTIERFGPENRLVGVLNGDAISTGPVLVLPNAGMVPRAGPFRLHVEIAQHLESRGIRTFRFDLPGAGESPHLAVTDAHATRLALDHLSARGIAARFVVGGVCSAADRGWMAAAEDRRVVGALLLDGVAFKGPWFQLSRIAGVLARPPREWLGVARRHVIGDDRAAAPAIDAYRDWPTRVEARAQLGTMLARDVHLLFVYTRGITDYFRERRQFAWSFGSAARDPRVTCHYWRDCDHTFYARFARARLLRALEDWFVASFGDAGREIR